MASCCTMASLYFLLSAQPVHRSDGLSKKVTEVVVETVEKVAPIFVPGRGLQVKDVLIDTAGAVVGIGMCGVVRKKRKV